MIVANYYVDFPIDLFDIVLDLGKNNISTFNNYANTLLKIGEYEKASRIFKKALNTSKNDISIINSYANSLVKQAKYEESFNLFNRALELDSNSYSTLVNYASFLSKIGKYDQAFNMISHAIKINPNDYFSLIKYSNIVIDYGRQLFEQDKYKQAFDLFERAMQEKEKDIFVLRNYARALANYGNHAKSCQIFEEALLIENNNFRIINDYAHVLSQQEKWERLLELQPYNSYARLKYAQYFEGQGKYKEALTLLLGIDLTSQKPHHLTILQLNLGRLYYRLGQIDLGKQFFDEAIANSDEQDKTILYAARSLLATNPNSQEAINLLLKIQEDSPRYAEAMKAIALNADEETSYELFGADEEQIDDIEMLYRAMYHKIGNEIAVLRSISYRLLKRMEGEHPLVKEIVNDLEKLQQDIASQRANEKAAIAQVSHSN